jgi:hypothetical protein
MRLKTMSLTSIMKILSIDVGMKYLAYCLFDCKEDQTFCVSSWGILNLCGQVRHTCSGKLSNDKPCGKTGKLHKDGKYFCKIHAKQANYKIPANNLTPKRLGRQRVKGLKAICEEMEIPLPKKIRKGDCLELINKELAESYLEFVPHVDTRNISIVEFGYQIKKEFDALLGDITIDRVLVENQVGPLALRMKVIQGMITQHFIERGCACILAISPANKLKGVLGANKKTTYAQRKKIGVLETRRLIVEHITMHEWADIFNAHKKKDDLADAFLQGIWYLRNNGLVSGL